MGGKYQEPAVSVRYHPALTQGGAGSRLTMGGRLERAYDPATPEKKRNPEAGGSANIAFSR